MECDLAEKLDMWDLIKRTVTFDNDRLTPAEVIHLGHLVEAVAVRDPQMLDMDMKHLETWNAVGRYAYDGETLAELGRLMISDSSSARIPIEMGSGTNKTLVNVMMIGSLGHLICALEKDEIDKIVENEKILRNVLPAIVKIESCPNPEALKQLATAVSLMSVLPFYLATLNGSLVLK